MTKISEAIQLIEKISKEDLKSSAKDFALEIENCIQKKDFAKALYNLNTLNNPAVWGDVDSNSIVTNLKSAIEESFKTDLSKNADNSFSESEKGKAKRTAATDQDLDTRAQDATVKIKLNDKLAKVQNLESEASSSPPISVKSGFNSVTDTVGGFLKGALGFVINEDPKNLDSENGVVGTIKSLFGSAVDGWHSMTSEGQYGRYIGKAGAAIASYFGLNALAGFIPGVSGSWLATVIPAIGALAVAAISFKPGVLTGNGNSVPTELRAGTDSTIALQQKRDDPSVKSASSNDNNLEKVRYTVSSPAPAR